MPAITATAPRTIHSEVAPPLSGALVFIASKVILISPMSVFMVAMSFWIESMVPFRSPRLVVMVAVSPWMFVNLALMLLSSVWMVPMSVLIVAMSPSTVTSLAFI